MMGKKSLGLRLSRSQKLLDFQSELGQTSLDKSKPKVLKKRVCWQTCYLFATKTLSDMAVHCQIYHLQNS